VVTWITRRLLYMKNLKKLTGPEAVMEEFYEFITERVTVGIIESEKAPEYDIVKKELSDIMDAIKPLITFEQFIELDSISNRLTVIEFDYIYRRGFFDAIDFLKCGDIPLY
jgi:hypothetical protein